MSSSIFDLFSKKMAYLTQRQAVIADNIANANTPGFKPRDLVSFDSALQQAGGTSGGGGLQMVATQGNHLSGTNGSTGPFKTITEPDTYEVKPSGNAVVLEQQMTELSQTYSNYAMVTGLYQKTVGMLKIALRGGA